MNQLNNISTTKGRKVFSRRILFFSFFILAVIALALGLWLKRTMDQEIKQDNIEKEITTEKEKGGVRNLHKKYKDMIGWIEIKDTGFLIRLCRQASKVIMKVTGSIIFTGMCMVITAFTGPRFWMSAVRQTVTILSFTVTTSTGDGTLAICKISERKHFLRNIPCFRLLW